MPCRRKSWPRFRRSAAPCAEALDSLKADHEFLKKGNVFSADFIDSYIDLKMEEVYAFEHTPHPVEFKMYYSV